MKKSHLVLVHSFPTNSVLLHGLKEFLDDYFIVHFIDLPGFHKSSLPFKGRVTLKKFSSYLDKKIQELDVDEYIVGGVSFGFLVVNNAKLNERCKGILAIEPYLNYFYLNNVFLNPKRLILLSFALKFINIFKLEKMIWNSKYFYMFLEKKSNFSRYIIDNTILHIEPKTFFTVFKLLINYKKEPKFHNLPYFLIGNFSDTIIDFTSTVKIFKKNVKNLNIISELIDHYPKNLTKEYFMAQIKKEDMLKIIYTINSKN